MKKLLLSLALMVAVAAAYGQGRVNFSNGSTTSITTNDFQGHVGNVSGAGLYTFGLYVGTLGTPEAALQLNILGTNNALAGRMTAKNGGSTSPLAAPWDTGNAPNTYPLTFQVRGWSTAGGNSYEEALLAQTSGTPNIYIGKSAIGSVSPTFSPTLPPAIFGTSGGGAVPGFELSSVPEPSSIA